ncbi:hypothetical protein AMECASPLE_029557 [Ameca splendens]|uniref:Uncharacterized protein n=1 Tax=Ameca splendens TaxID=208324 RepID=A0ABV0Y643_9TELE
MVREKLQQRLASLGSPRHHNNDTRTKPVLSHHHEHEHVKYGDHYRFGLVRLRFSFLPSNTSGGFSVKQWMNMWKSTSCLLISRVKDGRSDRGPFIMQSAWEPW